MASATADRTHPNVTLAVLALGGLSYAMLRLAGRPGAADDGASPAGSTLGAGLYASAGAISARFGSRAVLLDGTVFSFHQRQARAKENQRE